ncbi:MAG: YidC/Oxa1 family membrane protein insertase [Clostridia bacterium]|nr:YidC/Oxa1 family membrane protein insertase [Clostridia bacterium]
MKKFNFNKKSLIRIIAVSLMILALSALLIGCSFGSGTGTETGSGSAAAADEYKAPDGLLEKIAIPFGWVIEYSYKVVPNYTVALLVFAIAMKVVLFPFSIKQQKNSVKQASLRPKEQAIRKKYAGRNDRETQQKMQQEIMDLYTKENFNPMGGCLPLLVQFPVLFALYSVIRNPLRYTAGLSVDTINSIGNQLINSGVTTLKDLKVNGGGDLNILKLIREPETFEIVKDLLPDSIGTVKALPDLTLFGMDLSIHPTEKLIPLVIIPIVTFVSVYFSMKLTKQLTYQPEQTGDAKKANIIMDLAMPAMSTWFAFTFPGVLGVYWIFQNVLGVAQQFVLKKMFPIPVFTEEDYKKAEQELAGKTKEKKKKSSTPQKRHPNSLHHIDDDDLEVMEIKDNSNKKSKSKKENNSIVETAPLKDESSKDGKEE